MLDKSILNKLFGVLFYLKSYQVWDLVLLFSIKIFYMKNILTCYDNLSLNFIKELLFNSFVKHFLNSQIKCLNSQIKCRRNSFKTLKKISNIFPRFYV